MSAEGQLVTDAQPVSWNPALRPNTEEEVVVVVEKSAEQSAITQDDDRIANETVSPPADAASSLAESTAPVASNQPEAHRPISRHFAQSASIHQVPEFEEVEGPGSNGDDPFESLPQQHLNYTNSFPIVHPTGGAAAAAHPTSNTLPEPLPRSQAEEIVAEDESRDRDQHEKQITEDDSAAIDWGNDGDEDFLEGAAGGHDAGVVAEAEYSRYEEGVPLVRHEEQLAVTTAAGVNWGDAAGGGGGGGGGDDDEDDFFGGVSQKDNKPFLPKPLDRKSTEQVVGFMNDGLDSPAQDSGIDLSIVSVTTVADAVLGAPAGAAKEPDLAAAWSEALDDDDLLTEDAANASSGKDLSAFFEDDGEGFLEEDTGLSPEVPAPVVDQRGNLQGFSATGGPQRYNPIQPVVPVANGSRQVYPPPVGAVHPAFGQQPQTTRPEQNKAQSFVDKAKGGYESPYDLPMDLRPKRQAAPRQSLGTAQRSPQIPPPKAGSLASPAPPQSPFSPGQPSPGVPRQGPPAQVKSPAAPSAFFEELPVQARPPRPSSAARFTPASPPVGGPPQAIQAPQRPEGPNNPPNPAFNHGLVMPQRTLSFGENSQQQQQQQQPATAPPKPTNRYSPTQTSQPANNVAPPSQGRYSSAPAANPPGPPQRTSSANFAVPFQPRTSSPLARSTSISEDVRNQTQDRGLTSTPPQLSPPTIQAQSTSPEKQRSVSGQSQASYPSGSVVRHRRAPSLIKQYNPPSDERAQDPLERWKGGPIFKFGATGIVSSFPLETPRFSVGSTQPLYQVNPGEVKLRSSKTLPTADEPVMTFPGPLKNKGKKKELLVWLGKRVDTLKAELGSGELTFTSELARQRREDRVVLMQILLALVEFDGNLESNAAAVSALKDVLSPAPKADSQAGMPSYGSEIPTGITRSAQAPPSRATDVEAVEEIRKILITGDRAKAVWHAVDKNLWSHAMLIASTLQGETWKQVVHEFVRSEVKTCGNNTEALAALYDVFSGNWDESVDQLVPAAARSGFQMISSKTGSSSIQDALAGLDKWQETLSLIVSNRTNGDVKAIVSLGELLANYGRAEAAHVCYIIAKLPGLLTGVDDPTAHAVLLGANHRQQQQQQAQDISKDTDALMATEIYEFAINILAGGQAVQPLQYLASYKLQHALILADAGKREEAQSYCEVITASIKANKASPYMHPQLLGSLDDLVNRLSQAPKESSRTWLGNPKMGDVSNSLLNRFNKFVSGDDGDSAAAGTSAAAAAAESGPFGGIGGEPISISRTGSPSLLHAGGPSATAAAAAAAANGYGPGAPMPGASSRYAPAAAAAATAVATTTTTAASYSSSPGTSYTPLQHRESSGSLPRMSPDHFRKMPPSSYQSAGAYTPTSGLAAAPKSYSPELSNPKPGLVPPHQQVDALSAISDSSRPGTSDSAYVGGPLQGRRTSYEPLNVPKPAFRDRNSSAYQPRSTGFESRSSSSYAPRSGSYAPRSYAPSPAASERQPEDLSRQSSASYVPQAPLAEEREQEQSQEQAATGGGALSTSAIDTNTDNVGSSSEAPISFGGYDSTAAYGVQPAVPGTGPSTGGGGGGGADTSEPPEQSTPSYGQSYEPPAGAGDDGETPFQPQSFGGYEPPTTGYQPYNPQSPSSPPGGAEPKKKGVMDLSDDDDDMAARAAALKKDQKARADREADDAFRRAAEQDAKRDQAAKASNRNSWFGGWLGGSKKRDQSLEPTVHKAKLGDESSFVYDETLKKWVNKKGGADATEQPKATPPPPKGGPPSRSSSMGPLVGGPPRSVPPSTAAGLGLGLSGTPPSRTQSPLVNMTTAAEASTIGGGGGGGSGGGPTSAGPSGSSGPLGGAAPPKPGAPPAAGPLAPPSRPGTGLSGASHTSTASSIDDLLGAPGGGARKGAAKKGKKGGRYVDVMAK